MVMENMKRPWNVQMTFSRPEKSNGIFKILLKVWESPEICPCRHRYVGYAPPHLPVLCLQQCYGSMNLPFY